MKNAQVIIYGAEIFTIILNSDQSRIWIKFVYTIVYYLGPTLPLPFSKLGSSGMRISSLGSRGRN